jgi:hypothetical protein
MGEDTELIIVETDGTKAVAVKRTDLDLTDPDPNNPARKLAYLDNLTNYYDFELNPETVIGDVTAGFDFGDIGISDLDLAGLMLDLDLGDSDDEGSNENYVRNIEPPEYIPTGVKPKVSELFDGSKTSELISRIDESEDITQEEKEFLRIAAQRHTVLSFKDIAEYYSHASKPMQLLMEDSALVIIDFNSAISAGFVELTSEIAELVRDEYGDG